MGSILMYTDRDITLPSWEVLRVPETCEAEDGGQFDSHGMYRRSHVLLADLAAELLHCQLRITKTKRPKVQEKAANMQVRHLGLLFSVQRRATAWSDVLPFVWLLACPPPGSFFFSIQVPREQS